MGIRQLKNFEQVNKTANCPSKLGVVLQSSDTDLLYLVLVALCMGTRAQAEIVLIIESDYSCYFLVREVRDLRYFQHIPNAVYLLQ